MDTNPTSVRQVEATLKQKYPFELSERLGWAMELEGASRAAWSVAIALAHHASRETGRCWPGMGLIADETRMSRDSVIRGIRELEQGFGLVVKRVRVGKICKNNVYQLPKYSPLKPAEKPDDPSSRERLTLVAATDQGSSTVRQKPVKEPVREPKLLPRAREATKAAKATKPKPGRNSCACGNSWPEEYGEDCHKCPPKPQLTQEPPKTQAPAQDELELPESIFARADRLHCRVCKNSWPATYGAACRACQTPTGSVKAVLWRIGRRRDSEVRSKAIDRERRARLSPA